MGAGASFSESGERAPGNTRSVDKATSRRPRRRQASARAAGGVVGVGEGRGVDGGVGTGRVERRLDGAARLEVEEDAGKVFWRRSVVLTRGHREAGLGQPGREDAAHEPAPAGYNHARNR